MNLDKSKHRNYTFTWNNYPEDHHALLEATKGWKYIGYGYEVSPSTGTKHLQGFYCNKGGATKSAMIKRLPGCHIEIMKGNITQNIEYCSKSGTYKELGTRPMTQKKKGECNVIRYEEALKAAKEGRLDDIPADMLTRHYSTYQRIATDYYPKPLSMKEIENYWYYGPTGTGKSRKADEDHPGVYWKMTNKWWDHYRGEDVVVVDEVDKHHECLRSHILKWVDHRAFIGEKKGCALYIRPKIVIVTSNYHPMEIWPNPEDHGPMLRRFKLVHFPTGPIVRLVTKQKEKQDKKRKREDKDGSFAPGFTPAEESK